MSDENKSVKAIVAEKLIKLGESLIDKQEEPKQDDKKPLKMMAEGVLTDGTKIATPADEWAEGVEIFVEVEGEMTPLAPGEYELEDGTVLVVEQEGVLNEIRPAQAVEPAEPVEAEKDEEKKSYMDEQKVKAIVETLVKEYKFASHDQIEAVQKENTELKETIVMLSDALEELSKPYEAKKETETKPKAAPVQMRDASKLEGNERYAAIRERYQFN